jgi:hypothetical protein
VLCLCVKCCPVNVRVTSLISVTLNAFGPHRRLCCVLNTLNVKFAALLSGNTCHVHVHYTGFTVPSARPSTRRSASLFPSLLIIVFASRTLVNCNLFLCVTLLRVFWTPRPIQNRVDPTPSSCPCCVNISVVLLSVLCYDAL